MARPKSIPNYRLHRKTGRAIITVRTSSGGRKDILLPGLYDSAESLQEYSRMLALLEAGKGVLPDKPSADLTITELIEKYLVHADSYYRDPETGKPNQETKNIRYTMRPLNRLYGPKLACDFTPLDLRVLREAMATGSWLRPEDGKMHRALCRNLVNDRIAIVKRCFKWATEMMLVPASVYHGLAAVAGLRHGRSSARETEPVEPVPIEDVRAVLPHLPPMVRDIVELLVFSGMRIGELARMRPQDLEMVRPDLWLYRPPRHKNLYRGHKRTIALGPQAIMIVRRWLRPKTDEVIFQPCEQAKVIALAKRAQRKTPVQPSQRDRSKQNAQRKPGKVFTADAVNHALRRACKKAKVPRFHAHQLRHTFALQVEREFGLDSSRAALGHKSVQVSALYSGIDTHKAMEVAARLG